MSATARIVEVAEAVKVKLNTASTAGEFSQTFTAQRKYLPGADRKTLQALTVTVFAASDERTSLTRSGSHTQNEMVIEIGVQKALDLGVDPESEAGCALIDPLVAFAEELADFWNHSKELADTGAQWVKTVSQPIPDRDHLLTHRVVTLFFALTFKLLR